VAVICLVGGLVFGILVGVFFLPSDMGNKGLLESGVEIIIVNVGTRQEYDFGDYHYIFYNNYPSIVTNEYGPTVLELDGNYATIHIDGSAHTVLGLQVMIYEYNDDYVLYLAKLPER
jgi:hypothetical protein